MASLTHPVILVDFGEANAANDNIRQQTAKTAIFLMLILLLGDLNLELARPHTRHLSTRLCHDFGSFVALADKKQTAILSVVLLSLIL
jgi:hypothetical protein